VLQSDGATAILPPGDAGDNLANARLIRRVERAWEISFFVLIPLAFLAYGFWPVVSTPIVMVLIGQSLVGALARGRWGHDPFAALSLYYGGLLDNNCSPRLAGEVLADHCGAVNRIFWYRGVTLSAVLLMQVAYAESIDSVMAEYTGRTPPTPAWVWRSVSGFALGFWLALLAAVRVQLRTPLAQTHMAGRGEKP
jgi:hypothetical protein